MQGQKKIKEISFLLYQNQNIIAQIQKRLEKIHKEIREKIDLKNFAQNQLKQNCTHLLEAEKKQKTIQLQIQFQVKQYHEKQSQLKQLNDKLWKQEMIERSKSVKENQKVLQQLKNIQDKKKQMDKIKYEHFKGPNNLKQEIKNLDYSIKHLADKKIILQSQINELEVDLNKLRGEEYKLKQKLEETFQGFNHLQFEQKIAFVEDFNEKFA